MGADRTSLKVTSRGEARPKAGLGGAGLIALVAFLVPAVVFAAVLIWLSAWESGQAALREARDDAHAVIERVDDELRRDIRALVAVARRISGVPISQPRPAPGAASFNAELFPHWIGSLVWRRDGGGTVFSSLPDDQIPEPSPDWAGRLSPDGAPVTDGITEISGQMAVLVHVPVPNDARNLVVTTAIRPQRFLEILMRRAPEEGVSAIVDRDANFIARSLDHESRVGLPATPFVKDAVARGGEGEYRGRTWEGLENLSAYATSELSGWSAHVAISRQAASAALSGASTLALFGGIVGLALAAGLVWLILRDTRKRQRAERTLANARRVEAIGRLTGGIAHDFNNLLTVIIGSVERAQKRTPDAAQSRDLTMALEAARRAAALTRSLAQYSRRNSGPAETIQLNAFLQETTEVLRRTVGELHTIDLDLRQDAGAIRADNAQLASALLNLVLNARDAMPSGGRVVIGASSRVLARDDAESGLKAGPYTVLTVSDNGPGMTADAARRAFDPFFTTKDVGKGSGLGLAQVDAFARHNGGVAQLETAPGKGLTVTLFFPAAAEPIGDDKPAGPAAAHAMPRGLRVLLVEDEEGVREHASTLLRDLGCDVTECSNAAEAFSAMQTNRFDLLFSDIVLPGGKSGPDIAEHAGRHYPDMAILLATGYAREELNGRERHWPVLDKPYSAADLTSAIAGALESAAASVAK